MKWLARGGSHRRVTHWDNSTARQGSVWVCWDQAAGDEFVQEQELTKTDPKGDRHHPEQWSTSLQSSLPIEVWNLKTLPSASGFLPGALFGRISQFAGSKNLLRCAFIASQLFNRPEYLNYYWWDQPRAHEYRAQTVPRGWQEHSGPGQYFRSCYCIFWIILNPSGFLTFTTHIFAF